MEVTLGRLKPTVYTYGTWYLRRTADNKVEASGFSSKAEAREYCAEQGLTLKHS